MKDIISFDEFNLNESDKSVEEALIEKGAFKNDDGTWSVGEDTYNFKINDVPGIVENGKLTVTFKHVVNNFSCKDMGLTTLDGTPRVVEGAFYCDGNPIKNLIGGPERVDKSYNLLFCEVTSLEGAPDIIKDGDMWADNNKLTDLKGSPRIINGSFNATNNNLTTLEGSPEETKFMVNVRGNNLTDFRGWHPNLKAVDAMDNPITSLKGCPDEIHAIVIDDDGKLKTYYGGPKRITGRKGFGGDKSAVPEIEREWYDKVVGKGKDEEGIGYDNYYSDLYNYILNKVGNMIEGIQWKDFDINKLPENSLKSMITSNKETKKFNLK